jgi:predicted small lipoprotein YifL
MKRLLTSTFILALLMTTLACGLTAPNTSLPPTDQPPAEPTTMPTLTESLPPAEPPSPTLLPPTDTPTVLPPTPTLSPTSPLSPTSTPPTVNVPATRVHFAAGGTWTEMEVSGQANQATTFVLAAAQGQVMSVSVFEGPGYYLTITGADGTLLTSPDTDAYFWRGILPATQDYFVSVLAPFDGSFTLRVVINPPGQSKQMFEYINDPFRISLEYSDSFAPVVYPYAFLQRDKPALALNVLVMDYPNTNLSEAFFVLNLFETPDAVANCHTPYYEQEQAIGQAVINKITFEKSIAVGVGAGNYYEQIVFRTVQHDTCVEIVFFIHSANIGVFTPGTVTEFDRDALIQIFEEVLGTLTIK